MQAVPVVDLFDVNQQSCGGDFCSTVVALHGGIRDSNIVIHVVDITTTNNKATFNKCKIRKKVDNDMSTSATRTQL